MVREIEVEAAGGIVWRPGEEGPEVLVCHRQRYDDWSFPKGKLDPDEAPLDGALREIEEETGLVCEAGERLPSIYYEDNRGRAKRVRYWIMTPLAGRFEVNDEVDEIRWLGADAARRLLSYEHDVDLLEGALDTLEH